MFGLVPPAVTARSAPTVIVAPPEETTSIGLTVVQIESREAVDCIDDMAAVDGVDVLFIGPMDLSVNLGIPRQYDHKDFRDAVARIVGAAKNHGKAAGILLFSDEQVAQAKEDGFTFVALGSDGGFVAKGMRAAAEALKETG